MNSEVWEPLRDDNIIRDGAQCTILAIIQNID